MNQVIQIRRTTVADRVPATLQIGELALGLGDTPIKMWVGTSAGVQLLFAGDAPHDSKTYGRRDGNWSEILIPEQSPGYRMLLASQVVPLNTQVSSVDLFYNFNTDYDQVEIEIYGARCTQPGAFRMLVSTDGTTFHNTRYNYSRWVQGSTNATIVDGLANQAFAPITYPIHATSALSVWMQVTRAWSNDQIKRFAVRTLYAPDGTSPITPPTAVAQGIGGWEFDGNLNPLRGLRFFFSVGNIYAGVFNVYGIVKAENAEQA